MLREQNTGGVQMPNYWFDHVHLTSHNPVETAGFYEKMLGAKMVELRKLADGRILVHLTLNGSAIKISQPRAHPLVPGAHPKLATIILG